MLLLSFTFTGATTLEVGRFGHRISDTGNIGAYRNIGESVSPVQLS